MNEKQRLGYLDSIRGIAAFMVVLCHCWIVYDGRGTHTTEGYLGTIQKGILYIIAKFCEAGRSCVIIFFVLSGFVLAYSQIKQHDNYHNYIIKRIFRIYPTFLFTIFISYAFHKIFGASSIAANGFLDELINPDVSITVFFKHLIMWGTKESIGLDAVTWSLVHEMRISFLFPLILYSLQKKSISSLCLYFGISLAAMYGLFLNTGNFPSGHEEKSLAETFYTTSYFIIFFAAGAYIAINHLKVSRIIEKFETSTKTFVLFFIVICFLKPDYGANSVKSSIVDYIHGIAALILIALILGTPKFKEILSQKILIALGRISYSLYLIHLIIIYMLIRLNFSNYGLVFQSLTAIAISLLASFIVARMIEFPSIKLGKLLGRKKLISLHS